jgi:phosphoenolpyruvate phosphomutase
MQKQIVVSAGDAITAKLVQEAGFDGIWVSGFEASARLGLADNGSITMSEMLNITRPIVDAVNIPVWVDVDTGYGNFKRTVKEFEAIGAAGICVEDNLPHKVNSLWGGQIPLLSAEEFGKKISVDRKSLKIIARTEAIIRGYGQGEASRRMAHYIDCGADIVLPHIRSLDALISYYFDTPVAVVPTKIPKITNNILFGMGYSMVIWANQTERVKIKATREALKSLKDNDCAEYIEANLSATLDDMKGLCPDE